MCEAEYDLQNACGRLNDTTSVATGSATSKIFMECEAAAGKPVALLATVKQRRGSTRRSLRQRTI